ncbi:MAG TPA: hypothetical protein VFS29_13500 [Motilibacteraceae bacterium]|nr:hypothetical protein [Motilibacteraceae bacterium]
MTRRDDAAAIAAADLNDEMWRWPHLAKFAGRRRSWAFQLAAREDFPAPVGDGDRMWPADDVRAFLRSWRPGRRPRRRPAPRLHAPTAPALRQPGQAPAMRLRAPRGAA